MTKSGDDQDYIFTVGDRRRLDRILDEMKERIGASERRADASDKRADASDQRAEQYDRRATRAEERAGNAEIRGDELEAVIKELEETIKKSPKVVVDTKRSKKELWVAIGVILATTIATLVQIGNLL